MSDSERFAAQILEAGASAYAGYAASLLLERHPEIEKRYAPSAMARWKTHLTQRVLELSAALAAQEPEIFSARVRWAWRSFHARDLEPEDLRGGLHCLGEILREELPEHARAGVAAYLEPAVSSLGAAPAHELGLDPETETGRLALRYIQTALEGDGRGAIDLIERAADDGMSPREIYLDVLLAAQREVGEMWHLGELGIAEEHFVTSTTERALTVLSRRIECAPPVGKTVIAAAVAGNNHGLGVRALADFFELAGWRAICLGADVPPPEIATAAVYFEADLAVLSAALATQLKAVDRSVEALRALDGRELKILVGGVAFAEAPELWRRLGADGYAPSADVAVELGSRLMGVDAG